MIIEIGRFDPPLPKSSPCFMHDPISMYLNTAAA